MIRITLIAAAALATIATASSALAQAGAPVRSLNPAAAAEAATVIAERKTAPCADRNCASKPLKRGYVAPAPLGW
jgi:hypothetical protein